MIAHSNSSEPLSSTMKLILALGLCGAAGFLSTKLSIAEFSFWLNDLNKPEWNPPTHLFAQVWIVLYLILGFALWLVWKSNAPEKRKTKAELFFLVQLFFNFWWPLLFFKAHSPFLAFLDILLILCCILFTIYSFSRISKTAVLLFIPYLVWIGFTGVLNYSIWLMN